MLWVNNKTKKFADEYIISGNAYQSAISAGYSDKYAKAQSHKLLENVGIKTYIEERMTELESEKIADQKEVLEFLTSVIRGEKTQEQAMTIGTGEGCSRMSTIDVDVQMKDKIKAAELLGKRYSMWTDKIDATGDIEIVFEDDYGEEDSEEN